MKSSFPRILFKIFKVSGIIVGSLILLMFLLPYLFPNFVSTRIRHWARHSIRTELNFSKARLSFFRHFPALTLTLHDVKLQGSAPFDKESLIEADEISLGVDLRSVFSEVTINKIFLTNAFINIQADTAGQANYNIYISEQSRPKDESDSSSASLKIEQILIEKSKLVYNDRSLPILINARNVNYEGNGDLSKAVFDLNTHMEIESMDLYYDRMAYFVSKKINADLVTKINTNSLALLFEKNELLINRLPVVFTGKFEFLKEGYDMDFRLKAKNAALHDMLTALPPETLTWLDKTDIKGTGDIDAALVGQYNATTHKMPDFSLDMKVRDGGIANSGTPSPVKNLVLNCKTRVPGLNPDSLSLDIDSLYFNIDKDYFKASLQWKGLTQPWISTHIDAAIDLEKWDKAIGLAPYDLKGRFECQAQAEGRYATRVVRTTTLRKTTTDTVIASIPVFKAKASLSNGYFKYVSLPEAIHDISFVIDAACPDNDYKHAWLSVDKINASVLTSYIKGFLHLGGGADMPIDGDLETTFHLADIKKVYPLDSLELAGDLKAKLQTKGKYAPAKKLFPATVADLQLTNGHVQTKYYPHPMEDIQVSARITNTSGKMKDLGVALTPVSFKFEGQPFTLRADLQNFDDLKYKVLSKGLLDIGKIYQVFAVKGYQVKGLVEADLSLKGRQSDAVAGRYDQLFNSGTLRVKDLQVSSELFPQPFFIKTGLFRFEQDKMWFDEFKASYGKTDVTLNGWLTNVIGYMTEKNSPLHGNFELKSDYLLADEFMAYAPPASGAKGSSAGGSSSGGGKDASVGGSSSAARKDGSASVSSSAAGKGGVSVSGAGGAGAGSTGSGKTGSSAVAIDGYSNGAAGTGVFIVPANLAVGFHADIKRIVFNGIELSNFTGGVDIDSGKLKLDTTKFTMIGAPVEMNAVYESLSPRRAAFDYRIDAREFDVARAYREVKLFRDMATSASKAQGIISLNYQLSGRLDENMHPVYPSLKGGGVLSVKKVKVKGLRLFSAVSQESNKDVNDPDLSKVDIKTTINNNIITIARTKIKVSVFRLRTEGQASFDGQLNLKLRIGLPPFGLIGIPMTVTGTQENPKVKAGRGKKGEVLQETEDKSDDDQ